MCFHLILKNRPLEALDDEDFRGWLICHGADEDLVDTSSVVRALYDTPFQYIDGDVTRPSYAAGTALGVIARLVATYKGHMMWDIQAGVGEVLIAPLYEHLVRAGVEFKFFRKVTSIEPAAQGPLVGTIRLDRQADVLSGDVQSDDHRGRDDMLARGVHFGNSSRTGPQCSRRG